MGQILHKRARTTQEIRHEIQNSKESISSLARKFNISRATIYKWKSREFIEDYSAPQNPDHPSTI